jgi:hypothetical protein
MRTRTIGTARTVLFAASFVALGAGTAFPGSAFADTTSGDQSLLGGNQVNAPVSAPANACGNSLALFGAANASCEGGAKAKTSGSRGNNTTSGNRSLLGGNQINASVNAPVNVCGNAIAVFGSAQAGCAGGATVKDRRPGGTNTTSGDQSLLGGNQVDAPVKAPVNVCGNAVAALGEAAAGCQGGSGSYDHNDGHHGNHDGHGGYHGYGSTRQATGGPVEVGLPAMPGIDRAMPGNPAGALPALPSLSRPPAQPQPTPAAGRTSPSLPDLPKLPAVSDVELPTMSQAVRPAAAGEPLSSGVENSALYVVIVGALMAAASAAMAFARRIRFGRR